MRRDSIGSRLEHQRLYAKLLHECWCCHSVGLKPGVLATHLGDYGMRDVMCGQHEELDLSPEGLCVHCAASPPPEFDRYR